MPDAEARSFVYSAQSSYLGETSDGFIPNINGKVGLFPFMRGSSGTWETGPFYSEESQTVEPYKRENNSNHMYFIWFSAARCSTVYKNDVTYIRPRNIIVKSLIKY